MALHDLIHPRGPCQLGYIKIGGLGEPRSTRDGKGTWRPPRKDDSFTIRTMTRDQKGDLMPDARLMDELVREHGDQQDRKLRQLPVMLLSDDPEEIMQSAWLWYAGKTKLVARCDDEKSATFYLDPNSRDFSRFLEPKSKPWSEVASITRGQPPTKVFKLHTVFNCTVASREARWGGVYKFRTTSEISAKQLYAGLLDISRMTGGHLTGIPLWLVLRPMAVAPNGQASTVYVVHLELRGHDLLAIQQQAIQIAQARLQNAKQIKWIDAEYRKLLTAPGMEPDDEQEAVAEEFGGATDDAGQDQPQPGAAENDPLMAPAAAEAQPPETPAQDAQEPAANGDGLPFEDADADKSVQSFPDDPLAIEAQNEIAQIEAEIHACRRSTQVARAVAHIDDKVELIGVAEATRLRDMAKAHELTLAPKQKEAVRT